MHRRQVLAGLGLASLSGCLGVLPTGDDGGPSYPGGTLVVDNAGGQSLSVSVSVVESRWSASLDATVPGGESVVRREFVDGSAGEVATLSARIGDDGERTTFQFLPAGGEDDVPPEVAHLAIENEVEADATWTARAGTPVGDA